MVESEPEGAPRIVAYEFRYDVAESFIESRLDDEGVEIPKSWKIAFELRDLPNADLRKRARAIHAAWSTTPGYPVLKGPTEDPVEFIEGAERWMAEATGNLTEHEAAERLRSENAALFQREKDEWIQAHGSSRLRRANERDYKVNRLYARERADREFPAFWLETGGDARWGERTDPSDRSLDLEDMVREELASRGQQLDVRIVWLTSPPAELISQLEVSEWSWEEQEAILVYPYLGRYRLFLPVDHSLWRSTDATAEGED